MIVFECCSVVSIDATDRVSQTSNCLRDNFTTNNVHDVCSYHSPALPHYNPIWGKYKRYKTLLQKKKKWCHKETIKKEKKPYWKMRPNIHWNNRYYIHIPMIFLFDI